MCAPTEVKERPSLGALSYLCAGALLALVRLVRWSLSEQWSAEAAFFDLLHFYAAGTIVALVALILERARLRGLIQLLIVTGLAMGLGGLLLDDDVGHFSRRQEMVPQQLAYLGTVAAISGMVPLAVMFGSVLGRFRGRIAGGMAVAASVLVIWWGDVVLPQDYFGVHFFVALAALLLVGGAFRSVPLPELAARKQPVVFALSMMLCAGAVLVGPSETGGAALGQATGAAFSRSFDSLRPRWTEAETTGITGQWVENREQLPAIPPSSPPLLGPQPLVVLITIDALRADVVFSGRYDVQLKNLAKLRNGGIAFAEARAPGTLTKYSLSGLFLGTYFSQQYWSQMEGRKEGTLSLQNDETTRFVQSLSAAGVSTHNFRSINWVRNGLILKGFDEDKYVKYPKEKNYYTPAGPVLQHLKDRLTALAQSDTQRAAFVYSHLSDPHAPYTLGKQSTGKSDEFERYLAEVAYVDEELGSLIEILSQEPLASRCLLIIASDHGEAFGEHGAKTHGTTLYDEVLRVPLLFWHPFIEPAVVQEMVTLIDLGPTILDVFSLPTSPHIMGQSLLPFLRGESPELSRPILAETRLIRSLVTREGMKLIFDTRSGRKELYDLKQDPKEAKNLAGDQQLIGRVWPEMDAFFRTHTIQREGYSPPFVR